MVDFGDINKLMKNSNPAQSSAGESMQSIGPLNNINVKVTEIHTLLNELKDGKGQSKKILDQIAKSVHSLITKDFGNSKIGKEYSELQKALLKSIEAQDTQTTEILTKQLSEKAKKDKAEAEKTVKSINSIADKNGKKIDATRSEFASGVKALSATTAAFFKPIGQFIGGLTDELTSIVGTILTPFSPFIEASKAAFNILNDNSPEAKLKKQLEDKFKGLKEYLSGKQKDKDISTKKTNENINIINSKVESIDSIIGRIDSNILELIDFSKHSLNTIMGVDMQMVTKKDSEVLIENQEKIDKTTSQTKDNTDGIWWQLLWNKVFLVAQFLAILPMIAFMFIAVGFIFLFVLAWLFGGPFKSLLEKGFANLLKKGINFIFDAIDGAIDFMTNNIIPFITNAVKTGTDYIVNNFPALITQIISVFGSFMERYLNTLFIKLPPMIYELVSALINGVIKIVLRLPFAIIESVLNAFGISTGWFKYIYSFIDVIVGILSYTIVPILAGIVAITLPTIIAGMWAMRLFNITMWAWQSGLWAKDLAWKAANGMKNIIIGFVKFIPIIFSTVLTWLAGPGLAALSGILAAIPVIGWIILAIAGVVTLVYYFWDYIKDFFKMLWEPISFIWEGIKFTWDLLKNIGQVLMYYVTLPLRLGFNAIGESIPWIGGPWGDWFFNAVGVTVPQFADGGIVTTEVMAKVGEAGDNEAIIPLNEAGMSFMLKIMAPLFAGLMISLISPILGAIGLGWLLGGVSSFFDNLFGGDEKETSTNLVKLNDEGLSQIQSIVDNMNIANIHSGIESMMDTIDKILKLQNMTMWGLMIMAPMLIIGGLFSNNLNQDNISIFDKLDIIIDNQEQVTEKIDTLIDRVDYLEYNMNSKLKTPMNSNFNLDNNIKDFSNISVSFDEDSTINSKLDTILTIVKTPSSPAIIEQRDGPSTSNNSKDPSYEFAKYLATGIITDGEI